MSKKAIRANPDSPPPRSRYFKDALTVIEKNVRIGGVRYLMRKFGCGGTELVRYDEPSGKWAVLCFPKVKGAHSAASV